MKALLLVLAAIGFTQPASPLPGPFYWHDDYTEYHLQAPGTHQFAIVYYLNQRQAGLTYVLNQTRSGSEGSGIAVSDPRSGAPLKFDYMTGKELTAAGVQGRLNAEEHYIRAHLARPVPAGGEGRVRIEKTYKDEKSYFTADGGITFARSLGIGRNAIILPPGYKLLSSNVAGIVETLEGGRVRVSFENINGYASDVNIRAIPSTAATRPNYGGGATPASTSTKTLFELQADGTVKLTHHFVSGAGPDVPLSGNLGPAASMNVMDLDLGVPLTVSAPRSRGSVPFARLKPEAGEKLATAHIRVTNVYKDPALIIRPAGLEWSREFSDPRATIVLPPGYEVAHVNVPATVGTLPDGRAYVQNVNNRAIRVTGTVLRNP